MAGNGMQFRVTVQGVEEVMMRLGREGARQLAEELDAVTERNARSIANDAAHNAPVESGALKGSIPASVEQERKMVWRFGSDRPYARRQEYEHATKKGYFRKAIWKGRQPFRNEINEQIRRTLGG